MSSDCRWSPSSPSTCIPGTSSNPSCFKRSMKPTTSGRSCSSCSRRIEWMGCSTRFGGKVAIKFWIPVANGVKMSFQLRRQPNCFQDSKTPRATRNPTELDISEENHVSSTMPVLLQVGIATALLLGNVSTRQLLGLRNHWGFWWFRWKWTISSKYMMLFNGAEWYFMKIVCCISYLLLRFILSPFLLFVPLGFGGISWC